MNFCAWTLCWNLYEIITAPHGAHQKTETDYRLVYWWIEFSDANNDCTALLKVNTKAPVGVTLSHCRTSCKNHIFFFKNRNLQTSTSTPCTSLVSFKFFASLYLYLHCNDAYIPLSNGCRIFLFVGRRLLIEQLTRPAPVAPAEIDQTKETWNCWAFFWLKLGSETTFSTHFNLVLDTPSQRQREELGCSMINSCWATAKCRPLNSCAVAFVWRLALNDELKENKVYFVLCLTPTKPLTYIIWKNAEALRAADLRMAQSEDATLTGALTWYVFDSRRSQKIPSHTRRTSPHTAGMSFDCRGERLEH